MSLTWMTPEKLNISLLQRVERGKPFSLLRFGDGEYEVCKHVSGMSHNSTSFEEKFGRWFGKDYVAKMDQAEMAGLADLILEAFRQCDYLGIPCFKEAYGYPKWNGINQFVNRHMPKKETFYFYDIFTLWRQQRTFQTILRMRESVDLITCRPGLDKRLMKRFNRLTRVGVDLIQPEHFMWKAKNSGLQKYVTGWEGGPHYPNRYEEIHEKLKSQAPLNGRLYIVGAGGLGKIYCQWVKELGGMALDLGAMLDGWAGLVTRPYLQKIEEYRL